MFAECFFMPTGWKVTYNHKLVVFQIQLADWHTCLLFFSSHTDFSEANAGTIQIWTAVRGSKKMKNVVSSHWIWYKTITKPNSTLKLAIIIG